MDSLFFTQKQRWTHLKSIHISYPYNPRCLPPTHHWYNSVKIVMEKISFHILYLCVCLAMCLRSRDTYREVLGPAFLTPCAESWEDKGSQLIDWGHKHIVWHLVELQTVDYHLVNKGVYCGRQLPSETSQKCTRVLCFFNTLSVSCQLFSLAKPSGDTDWSPDQEFSLGEPLKHQAGFPTWLGLSWRDWGVSPIQGEHAGDFRAWDSLLRVMDQTPS